MTTPYICQSCGGKKEREHSPSDRPLTREWRARCISKSCRGAKRRFLPARRPITGDYR